MDFAGLPPGTVLKADSGAEYVIGDPIGAESDGPCDAAEFGGVPSVSILDGACRCLVCARCGHHTGNSHQGHYWKHCKVLAGRLKGERLSTAEWVRRTNRDEFHFCCTDLGCEMEERWLPVPGYEGFYEVSDQGQVRSLPRPRTPGTVLKPSLGGGGIKYKQVTLSREGAVRTWKLHRLVLLAFVGPMPPDQETRHGSLGPLCNRLDNLSYGTHAENVSDQFTQGTRHRAKVVAPGTWEKIRGEGNPSSRLTETQVIDGRRRHSGGESIAALAREFAVSHSAMRFAIRGQTWRHLTTDPEFGCELEPPAEAGGS